MYVLQVNMDSGFWTWIQWQVNAYAHKEANPDLLIDKQAGKKKISLLVIIYVRWEFCKSWNSYRQCCCSPNTTLVNQQLSQVEMKAPSFPRHWRIGPVANRDIAWSASLVAYALSHTVCTKIIKQQKRCLLSGVVLPIQDHKPLHYNKYVAQNLSVPILSSSWE